MPAKDDQKSKPNEIPAYTPPAVSFNEPFAREEKKTRKWSLYLAIYFFVVLVGVVTLQSRSNKEVYQKIKEFEELAQTPAGLASRDPEFVNAWEDANFSIDDEGNILQTSVPTTRKIVEANSETGTFVSVFPSPDSSKICLVNQTDLDKFSIYTAFSDGSNIKYIGEGEHCSWSPDSKSLAYNSPALVGGKTFIYVYDGSDTQVVKYLDPTGATSRNLGVPYFLDKNTISMSFLEFDENDISRKAGYSTYDLTTSKFEDFDNYVNGEINLYRSTENEAVLYLQSDSDLSTVNRMRIFTANGYHTDWITFSDFYNVPVSDIYYVQYQDVNGNLSAIYFDSTSKRHLAPQTGEE